MQVEILTANGAPVAGYELGACDTIRGNSLARCVTWRRAPDVAKLAHKPVRLHFVMRSMKLFAFQFTEARDDQ